jgi:hypothetical protein
VAQAATQPYLIRPFTDGMRSPVIAPLTRGLLGIPTFLFAASTATAFSWTIDPPLTAAVLGANYWGSVALAIFASRQLFWSQGRVSISVALAFAPITTAATFIHLELFHFDSSGFTLFITWFWVIAYSIYPVQLGILLAKQLRTAGVDPPRTVTLPGWVRGILLVHAIVLLPMGVLMFAAPGVAESLWPWEVPALSARALAAWVLAFGVLAAHSFIENDFDRVKVGLWSYPVLGVLHVIALARFGEVVQWEEPGAWVYVGFIASTFVLGAYGIANRKHARKEWIAPKPGDATFRA